MSSAMRNGRSWIPTVVAFAMHALTACAGSTQRENPQSVCSSHPPRPSPEAHPVEEKASRENLPCVERTSDAIRAAADDVSWEVTQRVGTPEAFRKYVHENSAYGEHLDEAEQRLEQFEESSAMPKAEFQQLIKGKLVRIARGVNRVDLDGQGKHDFVIKARFDNLNAHSYFSFMIVSLVDGPPTNDSWKIVPIVIDDDVATTFTTFEGADCTLTDYRFLIGSDHHLRILAATRRFGGSFADGKKVRFDLFETGDAPGLAFLRKAHAMSSETYCDVGEALEKELGIE